ncbi:MAG: methyltransferase, partial [Rickettsiales bacterium]|nr:methyltransferase [Rickettsiales bacterium]
MTDNQAFKLLSRRACARDARVVLAGLPSLGLPRVVRAALLLWRGVPVAKIIHNKWFYGLPFYTDRHTLDPRPDSEALVGAVVGAGPERILDLGTGTGCLLCAILKNLPASSGVGIDRSRAALRVARKNVRLLELGGRAAVGRGTFARPRVVERDFDAIVANPPYIPRGDLRVNAGARHDPGAALYGGADGLKYYRELAALRAPRMFLDI